MDDAVARSMVKWPDVPDVYGWLGLDRRGRWRIKGEHIGNAALRDFIGRNYEPDARGRWHFQNGPQRVFVSLAYTPLVAHHEAAGLFDHCGRPLHARETFLDDEGSVLLLVERGVALLDDRDLERYAGRADRLPTIARAEVATRFGFDPEPAP